MPALFGIDKDIDDWKSKGIWRNDEGDDETDEADERCSGCLRGLSAPSLDSRRQNCPEE
jgi:hypothetical protein